MGGAPPALELVANLAASGAQSEHVLAQQLPRLAALQPEFASVLVGGNDLLAGTPLETYRANAAAILDGLLARLAPDRIVVGIPDHTAAPRGTKAGDPALARAGIRAANEAMAALCAARGIRFIDVFDLSEAASTDRSLVSGDGFHPTASGYARWVDRIAPVVAELLGRPF